jgi:hypothetical protein
MSFGAAAFGLSPFGDVPVSALPASVTGTGNPLLGAVAASGTGLLAETGSGVAGIAAPIALGAGTVTSPGVTGFGMVVLSAPGTSGAGALSEAGAGLATLGPARTVGSGVLGVTGSGIVSVATVTATGAASVGGGGTGTIALAAPSAAGAGMLSEIGSGSAANPMPTAGGFGTDAPAGVAGSGGAKTGGPSASGAGQVTAAAITGAGTMPDGSTGASGSGMAGGAGMSGDRLQQLIYQRGYAMTAARTGLAYRQFRATGPFDPMSGPALGSLPALFSQDNTVQTPNLYGNAVWRAWLDGTQVQVGDILAGARTFFIVAQQPLLPILAVEAPRTVDIRRPFHQAAIGFSPVYGGDTPAQETIVMRQWPASILQGMRGGTADAALPDDVKAPGWSLLLPATPAPPVLLFPSDIVVDDLGRRFTIASAELTSFGWRLVTHQAES